MPSMGKASPVLPSPLFQQYPQRPLRISSRLARTSIRPRRRCYCPHRRRRYLHGTNLPSLTTSSFPHKLCTLLLSTKNPSIQTDAQNHPQSMSVVPQVATSRGNVTIASPSTADNPLVNPNWLATLSDQEVAVAGLKRARQIAHATGIVVGEEFSPGSNVTSDGDILDYIRREVRPIHHAVGTCKSRLRPRSPPFSLPALPPAHPVLPKSSPLF